MPFCTKHSCCKHGEFSCACATCNEIDDYCEYYSKELHNNQLGHHWPDVEPSGDTMEHSTSTIHQSPRPTERSEGTNNDIGIRSPTSPSSNASIISSSHSDHQEIRKGVLSRSTSKSNIHHESVYESIRGVRKLSTDSIECELHARESLPVYSDFESDNEPQHGADQVCTQTRDVDDDNARTTNGRKRSHSNSSNEPNEIKRRELDVQHGLQSPSMAIPGGNGNSKANKGRRAGSKKETICTPNLCNAEEAAYITFIIHSRHIDGESAKRTDKRCPEFIKFIHKEGTPDEHFHIITRDSAGGANRSRRRRTICSFLGAKDSGHTEAATTTRIIRNRRSFILYCLSQNLEGPTQYGVSFGSFIEEMTRLRSSEIMELAKECIPYIEQKKADKKAITLSEVKSKNMTQNLIQLIYENDCNTTSEFYMSLSEEAKLDLIQEYGTAFAPQVKMITKIKKDSKSQILKHYSYVDYLLDKIEPRFDKEHIEWLYE